MCGIAGVMNKAPLEPSAERLVRHMCDRLEHRGPDDEGFYTEGPVSLGMRRLSVIDIVGGHQPVTNEDQSVWAVFNGEIYNFQELRDRLSSAGHSFTSRSDSETIVHAYEEYGLDFPRHLSGMFAIALWDARRERLVLVRDRFGKKPLFYADTTPALVFGSELKALLCHPHVEREIDPEGLDQYLALGYVSAPNTILRGVRKLRPAHVLVVEDGALHERPYWSLEPRSVGRAPATSKKEAADELEQHLSRAVERRLVADVPVGAFLSAGLDSSVVVALMARLTNGPVHTFTIGLDEPGMNEAPFAERTAAGLRTHHTTLVVQPDFEKDLPRIIWGMDEPQADSSCIPTYYVSRLAREHVTVSLTGDGGDEIFAGYTRYAIADTEQRFDRLPGPVRTAAGAASRLLPTGVRGKGLLNRISLPWPERYASGVTIFSAEQRRRLYNTTWPATLTEDRIAPLVRSREHADPISALQWTDIHSYLADDILAKVDRMSMINSLETRCPLLDHEVAEFAFRQPIAAWYAGGTGKLLFREVARRLVPPELLARPKSGFGIPLARWLRGPLRPLLYDVLSGAQRQRGWFRSGQVDHMVRAHERGWVDHSQRLWSLLCLELWARQFLDVPIAPPAAAARHQVV